MRYRGGMSRPVEDSKYAQEQLRRIQEALRDLQDM